MLNTWLVLLPPFIILAAALITKRLNLSLILGLAGAAAIAGAFAPQASVAILVNRLWSQITDLDMLCLFSFLFVLGILISLLEFSGAAFAFAQRLTAHLKNAQATQKTTMLLSSMLFIDDYLSCLTTGYVMRPITDRFAIPRVKLAYLIHSFSGPLVILAPISSWVALIASQLENAGISPVVKTDTKVIADPFFIYLKSIPYTFYSIILLVSVWFIVRKKISYGPMHEQEEIAHRTGNLFGGKPALKTAQLNVTPNGSPWDLVMALAVLITCFIIGVLWSGGYWLLGGSHSFFEALQKNNQTGLALLCASAITLACTVALNVAKKRITANKLEPIVKTGLAMMYPSVLMVFLASTVGIMLKNDLHTGQYLAHLFSGTLALSLIPLLFYAVSIITAIITGSAWGTIALMIPIAVQMVITLLDGATPTTAEAIPLLFPVLGALFSGAVCGNHVSPIAETTILSSTSAGCYPLDHAITQFWYALPVIIATAFSFLLSGILIAYMPDWQNILFSWSAGIAFCLAIIVVLNRMMRGSISTVRFERTK